MCVESFLTTLEGWADEVISSAVKYKIWRISRESLKIPYSTQITKTHLNSGHNPEVRTLLFLPTSGAARVFKSVQTTVRTGKNNPEFLPPCLADLCAPLRSKYARSTENCCSTTLTKFLLY